MIEKPIKADITTQDNALYLYGDIGDDWDGVTLDTVKNTTTNMDKAKVTVHINSYGGDATEGVAIRNYLKNAFETIDVVIDGIAASAASVIATCGDTLTMPTGTTYMIHNPWTFAFGNRQDLLKEIGALESLETSYKNIYMERFTGTEDELVSLMDNESWLTAEEAETFGFATKTIEIETEDEPETENALVANLLKKYTAKADDKTEEVEPKNDDTNTVEDSTLEDEKPNNFLSNLVKTFS